MSLAFCHDPAPDERQRLARAQQAISASEATAVDDVHVSPTTLSTLLLGAGRYALGRRTIIVGEVCNLICAYEQHLGPGTRTALILSIDDALRLGQAGDPKIDEPEWRRTLDVLRDRQR